MNRRIFVKLTFLGVGAATLPFLQCRNSGSSIKLLYRPDFLSKICDEKMITDIGTEYRKMYPKLDDKDKLEKQLMHNESGENIKSTSDSDEVEKILEDKIVGDFNQLNTVIVKGWVLSVTEAQQCALFSLTPQ
jgi:hypothetical protein